MALRPQALCHQEAAGVYRTHVTSTAAFRTMGSDKSVLSSGPGMRARHALSLHVGQLQSIRTPLQWTETIRPIAEVAFEDIGRDHRIDLEERVRLHLFRARSSTSPASTPVVEWILRPGRLRMQDIAFGFDGLHHDRTPSLLRCQDALRGRELRVSALHRLEVRHCRPAKLKQSSREVQSAITSA